MEATLILWRRFVRFSHSATTPIARSGGAYAARLACSLLLSLTLPGLLMAQDTGQITGRIVSNQSWGYLAGAEVSVEGSDLRASAGRDGSFTLVGVPVGSQVVVASYPGMDATRVTVEVKAGETASASIALGEEVIELERFVVRTAKEGMAQAVALQKVSIQSKLVAAADQFGEISEGNVGEYLKFLPGVTVDYNVNDARGISLRGLSTAFTIVAVDGTPMAGGSSVDDTRRFEFEQIAMNNVETTELFKTVTPDIPAAATGGYVNFVTKSAFDRQEVQELSYNLSFGVPHTQFKLGQKGGLWDHGKQYPVRPSLDLNFSRKLNDKVGVNLNYRYSDKYDDAPRTLENWTIANGAANLGSYTVQDEQKLTHREAFAAKVDFKLSEDTTLFVAGQWNFYDLLFTQRGLVFNLGSNSVLNGETVTSGTAGTRTVTNNQLQRRKWGTTLHFNGTLEHKFPNGGRLSVTPYWSQAKGYYDDVAEGFISSTQTFTYSAGSSPFSTIQIDGISDLSAIPTITLSRGTTITPLDYLRNLGNYTFSNTATGGNFQSRPWEATDEKSGVNGSYALDLPGLAIPVKVTAGFALDYVTRDIKRPTYRGVIPAVTGAGLLAMQDPRYTKDVAFGFGPINAVDPYLVWQTYGSTLSATPGVNDLRYIEEDNTAGFVRFDLSPRRDLLLVGGVRWERREIAAQASALANGVQENATADLDYSELYPSLGFKYTPRKDLVVRGGVSRTVGHPDYADILPLVRLESAPGADNGSITAPAPDLEPYFTRNYDLSADYYLSNSGVVGLALFRKEVDNFISPRAMSAAELAAAATLRGYNPADFSSGSISVNGASSRLQGFELSYAQNLAMLPKPFNGLSLQANFTYIDVQADDLDTLYSQLRAVSPKTANVIVGYRYGKFSTTITTNWVDESLYGGFVNTSFFAGAGDNRLLRMKDEFTTTDIKVEWAFDKRLAAYVLVRNVFNQGRGEFFQGYIPKYSQIRLPMRYGEFGEPYLVFGLRGRF